MWARGCVNIDEQAAFCLPSAGIFHLMFTQPMAHLLEDSISVLSGININFQLWESMRMLRKQTLIKQTM